MSASSTHDTKRSEDLRARINVLSEVAGVWRDRVQAWSRTHRKLREEHDGVEAPSRNAEYLLYQTLIGLWPDVVPEGEARAAFVDRLQQYMLKVEREAKVHTSWISPNEAYEAALQRFVAGLFVADRRRTFLTDLHEFASRVAVHGRWNSLSQLVLKMASPGVPDLYQGSETWNLTLVDPDNRQPVDFAMRQQALRDLLAEMAGELPDVPSESAASAWLSTDEVDAAVLPGRLLESCRDGRIKLFVTLLTLHARREDGELFTTGEYRPLATTGRYANSVVAFARRSGQRLAIVVVPRWTVQVVGFGGPPPVGDVWGDTAVTLPPELTTRAGPLRDVFTRRAHQPADRFPVAEALRTFPIGLWRSMAWEE